MIKIRQLTNDDLEAADGILVSAFGGRSRQAELARYLSIEPDVWLMAFWDGQPAGMVGAVIYQPFAYIGLMGVHEKFQRRGIGRMLMKAIHEVIRQHGCEIFLLDASEKGAPLYVQLGYRDVYQTRLFFLPNRASSSSLPAGDVALIAEADLAELVAYDRDCFGADRRRVLATYLKEFPGRAVLRRNEEGNITGYLFAQNSRIGPWVARTLRDAEVLLATALKFDYQDPPTVIVPSVSPATHLLGSCGFELLRTLRHMYLGMAYPWRNVQFLYGQASFLLG